MNIRLEELRRRLAQNRLNAFLVSQPTNRRYLSGFTGSDGFLFITQNEAVLATDFRYIEQAGVQAPDFQVKRIAGGFAQWFPELVIKSGANGDASLGAGQETVFKNDAAGVKSRIDPGGRQMVAGNPVSIKYALNYIGFRMGKPRPPLKEPNKELAAIIEETIKKYRIDLPVE